MVLLCEKKRYEEGECGTVNHNISCKIRKQKKKQDLVITGKGFHESCFCLHARRAKNENTESLNAGDFTAGSTVFA